KRLVGFFVTIPLAFTLESYWALVAGIVAIRAAGVALSYNAHPYRPRFSLAAGPELFHFSKWLLINNTLLFLRYRSSDFIIGKLAGAHALGIYNLSLEIASLPTGELVMPINRAVFPGYAKLASTPAALRAGYLEVLATIAMFVLPAGVGVALTADLFVPVILGPNWAGAIPMVQLLAISSALVALQSNNGNIYLALGSPRTLTVLALLSVTIFVTLVISFARDNGAVGAALGNVIAVLLMLPINLSVLCKKLELKPPQYLHAIWRPFVSTLGMVGIVLYIKHYILAQLTFLGTMAQLLFLCIAGAIAYAVLVGLLWHLSGRPAGAERYIVNRLADYRLKLVAEVSA
ncbi:MAG: oligosaccharide flippase family protein, partial [Gammaproteobacteria bacterium]